MYELTGDEKAILMLLATFSAVMTSLAVLAARNDVSKMGDHYCYLVLESQSLNTMSTSDDDHKCKRNSV